MQYLDTAVGLTKDTAATVMTAPAGCCAYYE
eukprot:COSAG05_NODE_109_length_18675_cov_6.774279_17_plen_31_part_00